MVLTRYENVFQDLTCNLPEIGNTAKNVDAFKFLFQVLISSHFPFLKNSVAFKDILTWKLRVSCLFCSRIIKHLKRKDNQQCPLWKYNAKLVISVIIKVGFQRPTWWSNFYVSWQITHNELSVCTKVSCIYDDSLFSHFILETDVGKLSVKKI